MEQKNNKLALGVSFGFAGGAILGVILGLLTKDFAVWLAVGVGCGIAFGTAIGFFLEKNQKKDALNKKKIMGYIMAITGFVMLAVNAIGYLFNLDFKAPPLTIMGIVFVVIGMGSVRKA